MYPTSELADVEAVEVSEVFEISDTARYDAALFLRNHSSFLVTSSIGSFFATRSSDLSSDAVFVRTMRSPLEILVEAHEVVVISTDHCTT